MREKTKIRRKNMVVFLWFMLMGLAITSQPLSAQGPSGGSVVVEVHPDDGALLGFGYDPARGFLRTPCVLVNPGTLTDITNQVDPRIQPHTLNSRWESRDIEQVVESSLQTSVNANVGYGLFKASAHHQSFLRSVSTKFRKTFIGEATKLGEFQSMTSFDQLTSEVSGKSASEFLQLCGQYVVSGARLGAAVRVAYEFDYSGAEDLKRTELAFEAALNGVLSISGGFDSVQAAASRIRSKNTTRSLYVYGSANAAHLSSLGTDFVSDRTIVDRYIDAAYSQAGVVKVRLTPWADVLPLLTLPKSEPRLEGLYRLIIGLSRRHNALEYVKNYVATHQTEILNRRNRTEFLDISPSAIDRAIVETLRARGEALNRMQECMEEKETGCTFADSKEVRSVPDRAIWIDRFHEPSGEYRLPGDLCLNSFPGVPGQLVADINWSWASIIRFGIFGRWVRSGPGGPFPFISSGPFANINPTSQTPAGQIFMQPEILYSSRSPVSMRIQMLGDFSAPRGMCNIEGFRENPLRAVIFEEFGIEQQNPYTQPMSCPCQNN
jgi:hypothetical protein